MADPDLARRLGLDYPIVQAPIGSATSPALAAAVSNAGGLGSLALSWRRPDESVAVMAETRRLTSRPFAVNVVLAWPQDVQVSLALDAGAGIVWTFWGDPRPYVRTVHDGGAILMHSVGSVREARSAAAGGVDVLVAQGVEAGGHVRGVDPLRVLLAQILEQVPGVPVVAAGGLADEDDVAAVIAAGASGACLGTRFLCAREANVAPIYQQQIVAAGPGTTVLTRLFNKGWPDAPHRVLRNSTVRAWETAGCPPDGQRPGEYDRVATGSDGRPVERYSDTIPTPDLQGDLEALALYAGEGAARIDRVEAAADLVRRLARPFGRPRASTGETTPGDR
ncbi:MAG: nitronate monooxygenase [Acidobacteriota bacterium]|nr:nitronate monooxygenase [Acidobacteriota bacterium]